MHITNKSRRSCLKAFWSSQSTLSSLSQAKEFDNLNILEFLERARAKITPDNTHEEEIEANLETIYELFFEKQKEDDNLLKNKKDYL